MTGYKIMDNYLIDGVMYYLLWVWKDGIKREIEYPCLDLDYAALVYGNNLEEEEP